MDAAHGHADAIGLDVDLLRRRKPLDCRQVRYGIAADLLQRSLAIAITVRFHQSLPTPALPGSGSGVAPRCLSAAAQHAQQAPPFLWMCRPASGPYPRRTLGASIPTASCSTVVGWRQHSASVA